MKNFAVAIAVSFCLVPTYNAHAWGSKGHAYVAEVAFKYMNAQTRKNIMYYLDGMSIEKAASWMDAIKTDHTNDFMKPWHYIDIEKGGKEVPSGDNIITIINKTLKDLDTKNSLTKDEIKTRILYLFHLIGDLHQPLHVGYPGDKGGNDIKLVFLNRGDSNLHSVWDTGIIESTNMQLSDIIKTNTYSPEQLAGIQKIDIISWAAQSRSYLKNVYNIKGNKVNDFYVNENEKIIKSQLLNAGIRLASVLEHYFGKEDDTIMIPATGK